MVEIPDVENETDFVAEDDSQEIVISREFEAPREVVFRAFTDPKLYSQWIGPSDLKTFIERFDARPGGMYRFTQVDRDGNKFTFHGFFHEVKFPEMIIDTFEYENMPEKGHVSLERVTFEKLPGERTRVNTVVVFLSVTDRDGMIKSKMQVGVSEGYKRLDKLLISIKR